MREVGSASPFYPLSIAYGHVPQKQGGSIRQPRKSIHLDFLFVYLLQELTTLQGLSLYHVSHDLHGDTLLIKKTVELVPRNIPHKRWKSQRPETH